MNNLVLSDVRSFRKVIEDSMRLFSGVNPAGLISPYSAVPLITQALGLNAPLMGSGDSPYSVIAYADAVSGKKRVYDDIYRLPLAEKRAVIDEIYDMIAPALLGDEETYIQFLADTKYRNVTKQKTGRDRFCRDYRTKFTILSPLIANSSRKSGDFAHIVHYGYPEDLYREYSYLESMPERFLKLWSQSSYPIVNEITIKGFPKSAAGGGKTEARGWIIFVTNYTRELLESSKLRQKKILQAASLADRLGAKIIGMGGLVASFAQGGTWLSQQIPERGFTTGHAYTIGNIISILENAAAKTGLDLHHAKCAVVGAAGSIGSGCAKLLAEREPAEITLIDLNTFGSMEKTRALRDQLLCLNAKIRVIISTNLRDIKKADVVIIATNSPTSIIKAEYLKTGTIVIDDSFPKNITKSLARQRQDVIFLEGGIMQLPTSIDIYSARNMPDLMDLPLTRAISCKEVYGCFAETLTLGLYGYRKNYGLGASDPKLAKDILLKAARRHFSSAKLQCFDEAIEEERFRKVLRVC